MPYIAQTRDLTKQYLAYDRDIDSFRVVANVLYQPGMVVQLVSQDLQVYPDESTVAPSGIAANQTLLMGVIAETWPGFGGAITPPTYLAPSSSAAVRGTVGVDIILRGFCPGVLVDQSGTGAVTLVNGLGLVPSRATAGYSQGVAFATAVPTLGETGVAMLPATGIGSSLPAGALAQGADTSTVTGVATAGDVYTITIQAPYNSVSPGVPQTITFTTPPLTAAQAATTTTAATAIAAYLNSLASYTQYFVATSAAAVVTTTVNGLATPFSVTYGSGTNTLSAITLSLSGAIANTLSYASAAIGVSTFPATAATLLGGTGYKGLVPAYITPS